MLEVIAQSNEIVVVLSNELAGEPGDEFTQEFRTLLYVFALLGYWPQDFGEADSTHVTLFFVKAGAGVPDALAMTESFIARRGDV